MRAQASGYGTQALGFGKEATIGLKRILGVPVWLGALLSLLGIPIALPFGIMFMRSPL